MGCCWSDEKNKNQQDSDFLNERSQLLNNPVAADGSTSRPITSYNTISVNQHQKGDVQSAHSRILHQTADEVIDVMAIDSHVMEQHDFIEKSRQYSAKITMTFGVQNLKQSACFPVGVAVPHSVLAAPPPSAHDLAMINQFNEQISSALTGIKVKHKEELVVSFGV